MGFGMVVEPFIERFHTARDDADVLRAFAPLAGHWMLGRPDRFGLVHGDYRLDNLLFATAAGGPPCTAVDWQLVAVGLPARDIGFFLGTGLPREERARHERGLVAAYHDALVGHGVDDYSFEQCWDDYRYGLFQGPLITVLGAMYATHTERGDDMFIAMTERCVRRDPGVGRARAPLRCAESRRRGTRLACVAAERHARVTGGIDCSTRSTSRVASNNSNMECPRAFRRFTEGESLIPVMIAIAVAIALQLLLDDRIANRPKWVLPTVAILLLVGIVATNPIRLDRPSRALRAATLLLIGVMSLANATSGARLIIDLIRGEGIREPWELLFDGRGDLADQRDRLRLWYWMFDRGGPVARASSSHLVSRLPVPADDVRSPAASRSARMDDRLLRLPLHVVHQRDRVQPH